MPLEQFLLFSTILYDKEILLIFDMDKHKSEYLCVYCFSDGKLYVIQLLLSVIAIVFFSFSDQSIFSSSE